MKNNKKTEQSIPISVMSEMTLQSTGKRVQAIILSSVRSGLILIPALYILATLRGLSGIQEAQPLTNILGVIPAIFFIKRFFAGLKQENSFKFNPCIDKD